MVYYSLGVLEKGGGWLLGCYAEGAKKGPKRLLWSVGNVAFGYLTANLNPVGYAVMSIQRTAGRPRIVPDGRAYTVRLDEATAGAIRAEGGGSLSLGIVRIFDRLPRATQGCAGEAAGDGDAPATPCDAA
jgi:hypothetical protein